MNGSIFVCSTVLPVSSAPVKNGAVAVENSKIKAVGAAEKIKKLLPDFPIHDFGNGIILPGFVNCHTHLELGWLKPGKRFKNFTGWLEYIINKKLVGTDSKTIERSVKKGVETLIKSGVTTVGEVSSYGRDVEILKNSPLRTVIFREILDGRPELKPLCERSEKFEERFFPHAPYSCSPELIKKTLAMSAQNGSPAGIHLAESPEETAFVRGEKNSIENIVYPIIGKSPMRRHKSATPFQYLSQIDDKKTKITAVHMAHIEKNEIEQIRKRDMAIVLCPKSNEFLNTGTAPVREYSKLKRVGLGTDGLSSNTTLNFFDEIKALYNLLLPLGKQKAAEKAIHIATLGGARALFLENKIGSIEAGKEADLIFIKTGKTENPYQAAVSATAASVISATETPL